MPVYAEISITDSPSISAVQGNVTSISNTSGEYQRTYPLMHFTKDQLDEMQNEINAAPKYSAPTELVGVAQSSPTGPMSLLGYLPYTPSQRDQGSCGNCWVWASTGAMEIGHTINFQALNPAVVHDLHGNAAMLPEFKWERERACIGFDQICHQFRLLDFWPVLTISCNC